MAGAYYVWGNALFAFLLVSVLHMYQLTDGGRVMTVPGVFDAEVVEKRTDSLKRIPRAEGNNGTNNTTGANSTQTTRSTSTKNVSSTSTPNSMVAVDVSSPSATSSPPVTFVSSSSTTSSPPVTFVSSSSTTSSTSTSVRPTSATSSTPTPPSTSDQSTSPITETTSQTTGSTITDTTSQTTSQTTGSTTTERASTRPTYPNVTSRGVTQNLTTGAASSVSQTIISTVVTVSPNVMSTGVSANVTTRNVSAMGDMTPTNETTPPIDDEVDNTTEPVSSGSDEPMTTEPPSTLPVIWSATSRRISTEFTPTIVGPIITTTEIPTMITTTTERPTTAETATKVQSTIKLTSKAQATALITSKSSSPEKPTAKIPTPSTSTTKRPANVTSTTKRPANATSKKPSTIKIVTARGPEKEEEDDIPRYGIIIIIVVGIVVACSLVIFCYWLYLKRSSGSVSLRTGRDTSSDKWAETHFQAPGDFIGEHGENEADASGTAEGIEQPDGKPVEKTLLINDTSQDVEDGKKTGLSTENLTFTGMAAAEKPQAEGSGDSKEQTKQGEEQTEQGEAETSDGKQKPDEVELKEMSSPDTKNDVETEDAKLSSEAEDKAEDPDARETLI